MYRLLAVLLSLNLGNHCLGAEPIGVVNIANLMRTKTVTDLRLSPDGTKILYVVLEADFASNTYQRSVWLTTLDGPAIQLTKGPDDRAPSWSPNGDCFAYISEKKGEQALCIVGGQNGEIKAQFAVPLGSDHLAWAPDGSGLAFLSREERAEEKDKKLPVNIFLANPEPDPTRIFLLDLKLKKHRPLTLAHEHVVDFSWSPDADRIAYTQQRSARANDCLSTDIFLLTLKNGQTKPLVKRPGADSLPKWSPDGKSIAFVSQEGKSRWLDQTFLCTIAIDEGTPKVLSHAFHDCVSTDTPDSFFWAADGKTLFFTADQGLTRQLLTLDTTTLKLGRFTKGDCVHTRFSFSKDGKKVAFVIDRPTMPAQIYFSSTTSYSPRRVQTLNLGLANANLGEVSAIRWKSRDGMEIEGILVKPVGYKTGQRYPLVTYLHGGPGGGFLLGFVPQLFATPLEPLPVQALAGRGYAVFCPNPRGSDGYGQKFREAVAGSWGDKDLEDVLAGIDELVQRGIVDPNRLGISGYCYGGYLALCGLAKTKRFKAACLGACFGDLSATHSQTDIPNLFEEHLGGNPWMARETYKRHSPMFAAHTITAPTLLHHSERDARIPWTQSKQLYTILNSIKTPTELITYPGQGHLIYEPRMNAECMRRTVLWFDRWLK